MGVASEAQPLNSPLRNTCFAPGSRRTKVTLTGWAYNNGNDLNLNIKLVKSVSGAVYQASVNSFGPYRPDVLSYVSGAIGHSPASNNAMLMASVTNLPAGTYTIA